MAKTWFDRQEESHKMGLAQRQVFNTIPEHNYLNFFDGATIQLKSVVNFLALNQRDVARATGVPKNSVRYDEKMPAELRERFLQIALVAELVAEHFRGDIHKTALWFKIRNPLLGNMSPRDMIRFGRFEKVRKLIQDAMAEEMA